MSVEGCDQISDMAAAGAYPLSLGQATPRLTERRFHGARSLFRVLRPLLGLPQSLVRCVPVLLRKQFLVSLDCSTKLSRLLPCELPRSPESVQVQEADEDVSPFVHVPLEEPCEVALGQ